MSAARRSLTLLVTVGVLAALLVPTVAAAPAPPPWTANQGQLDRTIAYLQSVQHRDGGFGGTPGGASDPLFSAWIAMALSAGGVNPQDQKTPGGVDAYTYLAAHAGDLKLTTDFERAMLVSISAGTSPHDFGGRDLVALIRSQQQPEGWFVHDPVEGGIGINDTAFAILALSTVADEPGVAATINRAADWLLTVQSPSGGWSYFFDPHPDPNADPNAGVSSDMTAAVIEALRAADRPNAAQEQHGWDYIRTTQRDDGGFAQWTSDRESNAASTAWVVQAMWAAGVDPAAWAVNGHTPLDYLASMQQPNGSIRYQASKSANDVWMTAYATPAFAGYPLPVPAVPRAVAVTDPTTATGGVTSGGGGNGAPLFSRPQGQSTGDASGGVRQVKAAHARKKHHVRAKPITETQRSAAAKAATGTAQSNGVAKAGVTPVVSHEKKRGGTDTKKAAVTPHRRKAQTGSGGGGSGEQVTGRLLGRAPAGVGGTGATRGIAPGLRSAPPPAPDSSTTAIVLAVLLAAAALAGSRIETTSIRGALAP